MESDHSDFFAECSESNKQSAELFQDSQERRNRESEDTEEVEDVKYVNTQDYLDIGETVVNQWNRAAPEEATTLGFIKEEHIDPDDAQMLANTENITHLINKKVEVKQETYTFIKTEEQINLEPTIISKAEDLPVDCVTASVKKEVPCTSSELEISKGQVASSRMILHRLPTDTVLPSTTTSGVPVTTVNNANNNGFNAIKEDPYVETPYDLTETEEHIDPKNVILKKLSFNDIEHKLGKKQTETNICNNDHLKIHKRTRFKCDSCDYASFHLSVLKTHKRIHTGEKPFKCDSCEYASLYSNDLKTHTRKHTGEKPFKCVTCNFASSRLGDLKNHLRIHTGEKPFKCNLCDYASSQVSSLKTHKRTHSDEKTFKCDSCNFASFYSSNLKAHRRTHTGEKPFKCDKCEFASSRLCHLKVHIKTHSGEKAFKCDLCNYASSYSSNLKTHQRKHTGEKPFKCDTCGYASSQLGHLKIHIRTHTHEKPFKCDSCDFRCCQGSSLNQHKKRIHAASSAT